MENIVKSPAHNQKNILEVERKKQILKQDFERDIAIVESLFESDPNLEQTILDQINLLDQTAYTKENINDFPFLKPKIIFRLKQEFADVFKK